MNAADHMTKGRRMSTSRRAITVALLASLALLAFVACIAFLPALVIRVDIGSSRVKTMSATEYATAVNSIGGSLLQGIAGAAVLTSAYGAWRQLSHNIQAGRSQRELDRLGQITDRFGRSVEQLGSTNDSVRLGGIYAFDRIAAESPDDRDPIVNLLAAYVRKESPWPPGPSARCPADDPIDQVPPLRVRAVDVQAALTVLCRWGPKVDSSDYWPTVDLSDADLRMANLSGGSLWRVRLNGANLARANLVKADLRGADLTETILLETDFQDAVYDETTWWPQGFDPAAAGLSIAP
ncbi:pentapeptide repeat-containing protein [Amycolatopsis sp. OK19-0408]|uniref:Pentapeptide repeat-containing protein n=1 Tax=Amycolatopsis iheyensis TaxID=2945988 RepID=A0A9X2NM20_9PSEU|nr:pentapeptide repeat-containing protein [Amycolatopsis iheyensis]MCR6490498.1 pentapeptide repeat-containing protein [Amycolatopsis iheyensis]